MPADDGVGRDGGDGAAGVPAGTAGARPPPKKKAKVPDDPFTREGYGDGEAFGVKIELDPKDYPKPSSFVGGAHATERDRGLSRVRRPLPRPQMVHLEWPFHLRVVRSLVSTSANGLRLQGTERGKTTPKCKIAGCECGGK